MTEPFRTFETRIKHEWIDDFGHMNVAHYTTVCDQATWAFWNLVNDGQQLNERESHEYVILESHVHFINEVVEDDPVHVTTQLIGHDDKRFILFHRMWRDTDGALSATNEVKGLAFNLAERRIESFLPEVRDRFADILTVHQTLDAPEQAGLGIALKRR